MTQQDIEPILPVPETVREDVLAYRGRLKEKLAGLKRGEVNAAAVRAFRVPMGIYEQREDGTYMVRVRLGAGLGLSSQFRQIAALSRDYGNGELHLTTRQDIQIHNVALEDTPEIFERLLDVGLTSRGGGGNTVRNVSACPRAGRCPEEGFNVAPHAISVAAYLLQHRNAFNLPRKYKIAFSGCGGDCALASVADCGFFARVRDGEAGFMVYAGGGLGMNPRAGIVIEEFVPAGQAAAVAEAVRRLFDQHGDRANKHRARLRYVLERLGEETFLEQYRELYAVVQAEGWSGVPPAVPDLDARFGGVPKPEGAEGETVSPVFETQSHLVLAEKWVDTATVRVPLLLGNLSADDLENLADLAAIHGLGLLVATQEQELLVPGVPRKKLAEVLHAFCSLDCYAYAREKRVLLVTCAGASTCKLGLCLSRPLARAIAERFEAAGIRADEDAPTIRISGCPNSCGGHQVGTIGLEGRAKRHNGRLMPMYGVMAGGRASDEGAQLASLLGVVPAKTIPDLLAAALKQRPFSVERLRALVAKYERIPDEVPDAYYYDWGADQPFSLAGRGPGECGAGVFDVIQIDINEAATGLKTARGMADLAAQNRELYRALLAGARALLPIFGIEQMKDREVLAAFDRELVAPGWVSDQARSLIDLALDWKLGDNPDGLAPRIEEVAGVIERITDLFGSLDANLKFRLSPITQSAVESGQIVPAADAAGSIPHPESAARIDLRTVACPMNFVKAKVALEKLPVGATLEVVLDEGDPIRNVPASFAEQGQEVLSVAPFENAHLLRVRRKQ